MKVSFSSSLYSEVRTRGQSLKGDDDDDDDDDNNNNNNNAPEEELEDFLRGGEEEECDTASYSGASPPGGRLKEINTQHTNKKMAQHIRSYLPEKSSSSTSSSSSFPRKVGIQFYLWRVHDIDTVKQLFSATVSLSFTWVEDDPKKNIRVKKHQRRNARDGGNGDANGDDDKVNDDNDDDDDNNTKWKLKDFKWHPQITVRNILDQDDLVTEDWFLVRPNRNSSAGTDASTRTREEDYISKRDYQHSSSAMSYSNNQPLKITQFMKRKFTLSEAFELHKFPVDLQLLHIQLGSAWDCSKVVLNFNKERPSAINPHPLDSQEWKMYAPRLIAYDIDDGINFNTDNDLPLLSYSSQSASAAVYPKAYIALTAAREPQYYIWNIYVILFLLGTLSFTVFNDDPYLIENNRLGNMLTLILALVAFKLVLAQSLPSISYLTMLDKFTLGSMIQMFFVALATSTLPSLVVEHSAMLTADYVILIISGISWAVLNIWFIGTVWYLWRERDEEIKKIEQAFNKMRMRSQSVHQGRSH